MIVHAPNIHNGGGLVLLKLILSEAASIETLIVDQRFDENFLNSLPSTIKVIRVKPTIFARLGAEVILFRISKSSGRVLCFGNLPPLLPVKGFVNLFFQNTLLLKANCHFVNSLNHRIKLNIERLWLHWGLRFINRVIVQSYAVKKMFKAQYPQIEIEVWPFYSNLNSSQSISEHKKYDFIYVASSACHKNHRRLLDAWELLLYEKVAPSLAITLEKDDIALLNRVAELVKVGAKIENIIVENHAHIFKLYAVSKALIYPSLTESFGLPLLEAREAGLALVAAELDYVREYVEPHETFDPHSALSIARAVKRFLKIDTIGRSAKLLTARDFLKNLN